MTRIAIYGLFIAGNKSVPQTILYFRHKNDAIQYQKFNYQQSKSVIKELDAIEVGGEIKQFHCRPSADRHSFGAYILEDHLRLELKKQTKCVLVGLNRPYPNQRVAGSPTTLKETKHFIWAGKVKNELVIKNAKLLNKPIIFADQRSLKI